MTKTARRIGGVVAALALAVSPAGAQFFPYYGKNKVKYDNFNWHVYRSPHFEVYYYPEFEQHLARLVSYAESAYEKISNELKHEISFPIPIVFYKTHSEFEQTNLYPVILPEEIAAFAEPVRDRMVLPIDDPPDVLQGLITHELTHIFEFDIIPRSIIRRQVPLWVDEGLSDYMRYIEGEWDPLDLMTVRDAAVADQIPKLSQLQDFSQLRNPRVGYNLGHATFEFIQERFGKEGIRQFLFALRKAVIGGAGEDVYEQAFRMKPEEFDEQLSKWLKERFKPYRDKQIPSDYGKNLSPNPEKTPYVMALSNAPSPSGELVAILTVNRRDRELDVILLSAKDGSVVKNLTPGYSGEFEYIPLVGSDALLGRSLAWTADGNRVGFFGRVKKRRSLILVNVLTGEVERRINMVLDQAEHPWFGPDGKYVCFSALREGVGDIYRLDLETEELTNLTNDEFYDKFPVVSTDGKWLYYSRRISGHDKIYRLNLEKTEEKEQLTFGSFDDVAPALSADGKRLYYSSNEDDGIFNLRSLDLESGDILHYTDVLGGNFAATAVKDSETGAEKLMFTSYYKGEYGLYTLALATPLKEIAAEEVARTSGPVIDFVPPVLHQIVPENKRKKGTFEKLFLEGRPPVNVGFTSDGTFFGGSAIGFSDVLGDQNFTFLAYSVREFRTYAGSYTNLSHRLQYSLQGFDQTSFFFAFTPFLDPLLFGDAFRASRRGQLATYRQTGGQFASVYPFDKFRRVELSAGVIRQRTSFNAECLDSDIISEFGPDLVAAVCGFPPDVFRAFAEANLRRFPNGTYLPLGVAFVQETTRFKEFGPVAGSTVLLGVDLSPGGPFLSRQTFQIDARKYFQLTSASLFAVRFRGFHSSGDAPALFWFGGNGDLRGYPFLSFVGSRGFFANAELRFPLVDALITPAGFFGPIRGTFFANMGGAAFLDEPFQVFSSSRRFSRLDGTAVSGFGLQDAAASYGFGLTFFLFGLPLHLDWTKLTDISHSLPGTEFDVWIGFDF